PRLARWSRPRSSASVNFPDDPPDLCHATRTDARHSDNKTAPVAAPVTPHFACAGGRTVAAVVMPCKVWRGFHLVPDPTTALIRAKARLDQLELYDRPV